MSFGILLLWTLFWEYPFTMCVTYNTYALYLHVSICSHKKGYSLNIYIYTYLLPNLFSDLYKIYIVCVCIHIPSFNIIQSNDNP